MNSHHALARLLTLGSMAWFILWACAPMMSAPPSPPVPPPATGESGHGVFGGANLHGGHPPDGMGGYQYWTRGPAGPSGRNESGVVLGLGWPSGITSGGYYRLGLIKGERAYLGMQGAAGFIWLHGSIPAAVKVSENTWLTTQPSYSFGMIEAVRVPIGMSFERPKLGRIDAEIGAQFLNMSLRDPGPPDVLQSLKDGNNIAPYIGIGYAKAFGKSESAQPPAEIR